MPRYFYEYGSWDHARNPRWGYLVYDRRRGHTEPVALAEDMEIATLIVSALNREGRGEGP